MPTSAFLTGEIGPKRAWSSPIQRLEISNAIALPPKLAGEARPVGLRLIQRMDV